MQDYFHVEDANQSLLNAHISCGFFDPIVNEKIPLLAKAVNFKALIFCRLLVAAYPDVSVNHS